MPQISPASLRLVGKHARQDKVDDLRQPRVGKQNIARLDISMNKAAFECRLQALCNLDANVEHLGLGNPGLQDHEAVQRPLLD